MLQSPKADEKEERGFFDYCSDDCVSIVQWKDNNVVDIGLNFNNIEFKDMVKRCMWSDKKKIECFQPSYLHR